MGKKILLSLTVFLIVFAVGAAIKTYTYAGTGQSGAGFPWGGSEEQSDGNPNNGLSGYETGVGWISMNSINCDTNGSGSIDAGDSAPSGCPPIGTAIPNYGVDIPASDDNVTGYAWSPNIGWIDFAPVPDPTYPTVATGDDYSYAAQRVGDELRGWARIVGIQTESGNSGGWQGWIRLHSDSDDPVSYGLDITKMDGTGNNPTYAWSDELGWVDFSRARRVIPNVLKVCQDNCYSGFSPISNGSTFNMLVGDFKYYEACWSTTLSCDDSNPAANVTNLALWNETDNPNNAVAWSETNPKKLTANSAGSEGLSVVYNQTISFTVNVSSTVSCYTCEADCSGPTSFPGASCSALGKYDTFDACNIVCVAPPSGTNWKEVAP